MGRETSTFLDEVRTVLSRAKTARRHIRNDPNFSWGPYGYHGPNGYVWTVRPSVPHPGLAEGIKALDDLIEALEPFARTGKTIKR